MDEQVVTGLGTEAKKEWPKPPKVGTKPIELLAPGSPIHATVLAYLTDRITMSELAMSPFYDRWEASEKRFQTYINVDWKEAKLKEQNAKGRPPQAVEITIPYTFATISTIVTYLLHTFCGRKPMFQVGSYNPAFSSKATKMEIVLQYNADHVRMIKHLVQMFQDCQVYGLGILRTGWEQKHAFRTVRQKLPMWNLMGMMTGGKYIATRQKKLVYSGNTVVSQDPYKFFPDPRVPMNEVNRKGEFVFWREFEGKHTLKILEAEGIYKWIDAAATQLPQSRFAGEQTPSSRNLITFGSGMPGRDNPSVGNKIQNFYQVDQGSVEIIPAELGLGESERPEKWIFTVLNKSQIIQAEPYEADHDMHPVCVAEPYQLGYSFGSPGMSDYLGPMQDTISWFINSHILNVRAALNNMFIVDPSMIEMQDFKNPGPGKILRLKRAAYGQDVRAALSQLNVADVTGNHMKDMEAFVRFGQQLSSVTDNIMGLQDSGGRKTATEVRTSGEAGASRLAAQARIISTHAVVDLTEQMTINCQQYMDEPFFYRLVGTDGILEGQMDPTEFSGDFYYPVHDGTLPLDKVALLDVWKEIFLATAKDPELRQQYSVPKIFEWVAELGGARNISSFKLNVVPDAQVQMQQQQGNVVPLQAPLTPGNPAGRVAAQ